MSTCKDCFHYEACSGFTPTDLDQDVFDYCRKGIADEIPDIEERCGSFMDKADVVEVRHGKWQVTDSDIGYVEMACSLCGCKHVFYTDQGYNYCSKCGAKMDGERKDAE